MEGHILYIWPNIIAGHRHLQRHRHLASENFSPLAEGKMTEKMELLFR